MGIDPSDPSVIDAIPPVPVNMPTPVHGQIALVDHDPEWPEMYAREEIRLRRVLGERALRIEHIGSTSVPELCAKPCIDILLTVADSSDEEAYAPDLIASGYVLRIREPGWHEHRMFNGPEITLNLHVFTEDDAIVNTYLDFRDWLRGHPEDRERYVAEKRRLASMHWKTLGDYADAKDDIVREIKQRIRQAGS